MLAAGREGAAELLGLGVGEIDSVAVHATARKAAISATTSTAAGRFSNG